MKLINALIAMGLLLAVLVSRPQPVQAGSAPSGPCCVCTTCTFSEHCFTGLTPREPSRCTELCNTVICDAGELRDQACETLSPLCEVITPANAAAVDAPAMRPLTLLLAALGAALVGARRLARNRSAKISA